MVDQRQRVVDCSLSGRAAKRRRRATDLVPNDDGPGLPAHARRPRERRDVVMQEVEQRGRLGRLEADDRARDRRVDEQGLALRHLPCGPGREGGSARAMGRNRWDATTHGVDDDERVRCLDALGLCTLGPEASDFADARARMDQVECVEDGLERRRERVVGRRLRASRASQPQPGQRARSTQALVSGSERGSNAPAKQTPCRPRRLPASRGSRRTSSRGCAIPRSGRHATGRTTSGRRAGRAGCPLARRRRRY